MIAVIHQPNLFPRLKVLEKISQADIWVIYDDVQYLKREWQNRARLRHYSQPTQEFWLTAPVYAKHGRSTLIKDVEVVDRNRTYEDIDKICYFTYHRSDYWFWIQEYLDRVIKCRESSLSRLAADTSLECFKLLDLDVDICFSSELAIAGDRNSKLVNICKAIGATAYLTGSGGLRYLDFSLFEENNIDVLCQDWQSPRKSSGVADLDWRDFAFLDYVARAGEKSLAQRLR